MVPDRATAALLAIGFFNRALPIADNHSELRRSQARIPEQGTIQYEALLPEHLTGQFPWKPEMNTAGSTLFYLKQVNIYLLLR